MKSYFIKYVSITCAVCIIYLFFGFFMREMGMTQSTRMNKHCDNSFNSIITESASETEDVINNIFEKPSLIEIIFNPADTFFKWIGL